MVQVSYHITKIIQTKRTISFYRMYNTINNNNNRIIPNPRPLVVPLCPDFGSGPCKKRPGYSLNKLEETAALGRSHRSEIGKKKLNDAIIKTKKILNIPSNYYCAIVPGSDTGAFEMAMWNLLGPLPVDVCYWETFGKNWYKDIINELKLKKNVNEITVKKYGEIPDYINKTDTLNNDIIFTYNGTTSGVRLPDLNWIHDNRKGLIFNDATSAVFAMHMDWLKIDVCTFSWQKVLGGEGAHGMLILSPKAIERLLENICIDIIERPIPRLFQLKNKINNKVNYELFEGNTINTPSMLCVEDYLDALHWIEYDIGGLEKLIEKSIKNYNVIENFIYSDNNNNWIDFLVKDKKIRSNTSVCLEICDKELPLKYIKMIGTILENEKIAFDINSYRDAPLGLRIWCGATVEEVDLRALCPWIKWAYTEAKNLYYKENIQ